MQAEPRRNGPSTNRAALAERFRRERLQLALEAGRLGVWEWEVETGTVSWTPPVYEIHGVDPGEFEPSYESFLSLVLADDRELVEAAIESSLETGAPYHVRFRIMPPDGRLRWVETWARVLVGSEGRPVGMVGATADITARKASEAEREALLRQEREARAQAEAARQRMSYLTRVSAAVGSSLDPKRTIDLTLRSLVPDLGDWCVVYLKQKGDYVVAGARHRDAERQRTLDALLAGYTVDPDQRGGLADVIRTGVPVMQSNVPLEELAARGLTEEQQQQAESIGVGSYVIVPLRVGEQPFGALSLGVGRGGRPYDADDLELAEQIADRVAVAIDHARLYADRATIARTLQRALLPADFPDIPGIEVAGRYRSAGAGLDVGGDFFDVFAIDRNSWGVAIGDVSGKGHDAAETTTLARHTIRAMAVMHRSPANVLANVNAVLLDHSPRSRFCTAVYGLMERVDGVARLRFSVAGHPAPLILRADGAVRSIGGRGVLLGMFADAAFDETDLTLDQGDALVLYTDGITDVRVGGGVLGEEWIRSELEAAAGGSANEIAQSLETALMKVTPDGTQDDVAVLVVQMIGPAAAGD